MPATFSKDVDASLKCSFDGVQVTGFIVITAVPHVVQDLIFFQMVDDFQKSI